MKEIVKKKDSNILKVVKNKCDIALLVVGIYISNVVVAFAGIKDAGSNVGTWIKEQAGYIALAIIAVMLVRFLIKKAWIPAVTFAIIGGICLVIIQDPQKLADIGSAFYNIIVGN